MIVVGAINDGHLNSLLSFHANSNSYVGRETLAINIKILII